ncbi:beta-microseminoprotein-like [Toxotes jaculatrix]|uniref:beta-microseminoprotein-like n=1 Tax=Toxotes jaculatrix TaxID=941984 RepID=UPI001B3AE0E0|nr:beta-microseminoprotein-like [Toxotes jaculatrix]
MCVVPVKKSLGLALLLCALPSLSNAVCYAKTAKSDITHCQDDMDKTWHAVGSQWRNSVCMDCTCSECCSVFFNPQHFPDDCVKVFDPEICQYILYKKNDPSVMCPVYAGVLK